MEDLLFENEYNVTCYNKKGRIVCKYGIEADHIVGVVDATKEFFANDYPEETLSRIKIQLGNKMTNYYCN